MFKKVLLTLSLMAVVGMITAQSLQFEYEGTVYEDGQTIVCEYSEDFGEYHQENIRIKNLTNDPLDVMVEKEIIESLPGSSNWFCWGLCYNPEQMVSSNPVSVPAQTLSSEPLSFHFMFDEGVIGRTSVKVYAFARSNPEERISLVFVADNVTNTKENYLNLGHAYPNPASSQVHFEYNADDNADINVVVYNLLGQEVKSQLISGNQNRISIAVDDMQPGIYFCRFSVNGEVVKTEKFIVKR
ncbi:MAG: T9SS type A sorting domain-containing protein [Bacteroidales bacterium]|nr:T9SS type A sorting domain-containing protein [Bacteroidales bacterium]